VKFLLLRFFARNLDNIIAFFQGLDQQLEKLIEKEVVRDKALAGEQQRIENERLNTQGKIETAARLQQNVRGIVSGQI